MKWISINEFLPGHSFSEENKLIIRCINKSDNNILYLQGFYEVDDDIWFFSDDYIEEPDYLEEEELEKFREVCGNKTVIVTHWMIPDKL